MHLKSVRPLPPLLNALLPLRRIRFSHGGRDGIAPRVILGPEAGIVSDAATEMLHVVEGSKAGADNGDI